MAWIKVPPEHRPIFPAALPKDPRIETVPMFGGLMARDGRARSDKVMLPEAMMREPNELASWLRKAFSCATRLPAKAPKLAKKARAKTAATGDAPSAARPTAKKAKRGTNGEARRSPQRSLRARPH